MSGSARSVHRLGGRDPGRRSAQKRFAEVHALTPELTTPDEARSRAGYWLSRLAARVARAGALPTC